MTTKVRVTLEEFTGYPVNVGVKDLLSSTRRTVGVLREVGDSVEVCVHQNQDVVVGEIKTNAA